MGTAAPNYRQLLWALIAGAITVPIACAGKTQEPESNGTPFDSGVVDSTARSGADGSTSSGSSGGPSSSGSSGSSSSGSGSSSSGVGGCEYPSQTVDPTKCEPQLQSETLQNGTPCFWTIELPCSDGNDGGDAGTIWDAGSLCAACLAFFDAGVSGVGCSTSSNGASVYASCGLGCCLGGRAPRGFVPRRATGNPRAARLAQMAQVEAASVDAFHSLHADLARLGAPRELLTRIRAAARDEVRHARMVSLEAERFGAVVPQSSVAPIAPRTLEELATDNAVEGCVRETFGAAVAAMQAERATDPRVRRMMRAIAHDELGHAALAWQIASWLDERLDEASRARVREAREAALEVLRTEAAWDGEGDETLGLPGGDALAEVLRRLEGPLVSGDRGLAA